MPLNIIATSNFSRTKSFTECEKAFTLATTFIPSRNVVEEFLTASIWPLASGWKPNEIKWLTVGWFDGVIPFPRFGLELPKEKNAYEFVCEIERQAVDMLGTYHDNEYQVARKLVTQGRRVNRISLNWGSKPRTDPNLGFPLKECAK